MALYYQSVAISGSAARLSECGFFLPSYSPTLDAGTEKDMKLDVKY